MRLICAWVLITIVLVAVNAQENPMPNSTATSPQLSWVNASNAKLERELIAKYGEAQRLRLERGLRQVGEFWRPEDGDAAAFEEMFGGYDPSAHIIDDFFQNKLAFVALLNFPLTTLDERLKEGPSWTRRQWAEVRLAQRFS